MMSKYRSWIGLGDISALLFTTTTTILFIVLASSVQRCQASVTVYYQLGQTPMGTGTITASGAAASYTGAAAYNPTTLIAPAPPGPSVMPTNFQIQLSPAAPPGVSIPLRGSFFGFSIEMSVVNQVLGKNASFLQVPFLNLMANLQSRSGRVDIRVGGNTQETAVLVDNTPDGKILEKDLKGASNPTQTPPLLFTPELLYMLRNISSLVNVRWYLGIPFNDTENLRLGIAEKGQQILGDYLIGLQVGNEPDLYAAHGHRPQTYNQYDYFGEFGVLVNAVNADDNIPKKNLLIGPNVNSGAWTPEMVWDTGFIDTYTDSLAFLAVEHYPTDNCFAQFGIGTQRNPQDMFPTFLNHTAGQSVITPYLASTALAQTKGKEFLMFETNTASCGGFPGVSDSFGAALWGLDYGMQMAYSNFSGALFHIGGQNVFYNPFTPPPTNQSTFRQWTIGPIYYSALVMAEALGGTNTTQVLDVQANGNSIFSPAYAIYEHGQLSRALLINFVSDNSGASDLTIGLTIPAGGPTPSQVKVKYLSAASVSQKGNITWAGQTFGLNFQSDGRLMGREDIQNAPCAPATDGSGSTVCEIRVPAPAAALVFFADLTETAAAPSETFATTAKTRVHNTASIDPSVLATSNGHWVSREGLSSTSEGSISAAREARERMWKSAEGAAVVLGFAVVAGWGVVMV
ncbi:glycoside hydrolase family 79 protein [Panaeolus papilionaceus]|nr:glycoside hydrolase family 79 protein [Panaeolus papilionaceus]